MFEALLLMVSVGMHSASSLANAGSDLPAAPEPVAQAVIAEETPAVVAEESMPVAEVEPVPSAPDPEPEVDSASTQVAIVAPPATPSFLTPNEPQLVAEPQVATGKFTTALEVRPILNATRGNWITLREYDGKDLVYVTHLWAWRCGLLELRLGINGNTPEPWPMPECHMDLPTPAAILDGDGLPYRGFALGSVAMIEVQITYDDLTTSSIKFNRQGRIIE